MMMTPSEPAMGEASTRARDDVPVAVISAIESGEKQRASWVPIEPERRPTQKVRSRRRQLQW